MYHQIKVLNINMYLCKLQMATDLFIVLIGPAGQNNGSHGQVPDPDDFIGAINVAAQHNINLHLILVDPGFNRISDIDKQKIDQYPEGYYQMSSDPISKWEYIIPNINSNGVETMIDIRKSSIPIIVFDFTSSEGSNYIWDLIDINVDTVVTSEGRQRAFVVPSGCTAKPPILMTVVSEYINYMTTSSFPNTNVYLFSKYDLYSGDKVPENLGRADVEEIRNLMNNTALSIKHFLLAKWDGSRGVSKPLPPWAITNLRVKLLEDSAPVITNGNTDLVASVTTNPEFQHNLLDRCLGIVSTFIVNERIPLTVNIVTVTDWYNPEIWNDVIKHIGAWRRNKPC
jgi:hypothetical protein